jgi:hypothetical protein
VLHVDDRCRTDGDVLCGVCEERRATLKVRLCFAERQRRKPKCRLCDRRGGLTNGWCDVHDPLRLIGLPSLEERRSPDRKAIVELIKGTLARLAGQP